MPIEVWMWVLTGACTLIFVFGSTIFVMLREEAKNHASLIQQKANADDIAKIEDRWKSELTSVKEGNEKLIDKLEAKHTREIDSLSTRFGEMLRNTENNIMSRFDMMMDMWKQDRNRHD